MKIELLSAFRNSTQYLSRYMAQVYMLRERLAAHGHTLHLLLGEGDSTDATRPILESLVAGWNARIIDVAHGGITFGSIVDAERFKQLAHIGNALWSQIALDTDIVVWVEADLIWSACSIYLLIDDVMQHSDAIIAPLVLLERPGHPDGTFYDVWAFRKNGKNFRQKYPYFDGYNQHSLHEIDSAGSCIVMNASIARKTYFPEENVFVGLCDIARTQGHRVLLDADCTIVHK